MFVVQNQIFYRSVSNDFKITYFVLILIFDFLLLAERDRKLYFIHILNALQNDSNHCLSSEKLRKLKINCKIDQIFCFKFAYLFVVLFYALMIAIFSTTVYMSQENNYSLILLIIWFVLSVVWISKISRVALTTLLTFYLITFYLKLRFQQISEQFTKKLSDEKSRTILGSIHIHNRVTVITDQCNQFFRYILAILYFFGTVFINVMLCVAIIGHSQIYLRFILINIVTVTIFINYSTISSCAKLSTEAHLCYNTVNSIAVKTKLSLFTQLKVKTIHL